ncbi:MAG: monovalent cation/H+ antiporter subunit D family protein [Rhodospirillales bacterium]
MSIAEHYIILVVVVPLMAAPVCVVLRNPSACWLWSALATAASFAMSLAILGDVREAGVISYELGDWIAPFGIEYRADMLTALILIIVSGIGLVAMPFMAHSVAREIPRERGYLYYTMYLLCFTGLLGMTVTGDAFNLFVFLEISSLSTYVLISLGKDRRALTAALRYLILGTIGATFYVIGVGLMYMSTGTLNIADLNILIPVVIESRTVQAALAFLTVGVCLKLALFPLHVWLPSAYAYAPSAVTVFLAATATKVAVYALIRLYFTVFSGVNATIMPVVGEIWLVLAVAGMFAGSLVAIYQTDIKRMLAYSSVAQIGYIILGLSFATETGITAGLIHLFNHAIMKGALFMALGCVVFHVGRAHIGDLAGIGKRMPLTAAAFVLGGLSLIGVPGTVGFISKWYLIDAALTEGLWIVAALILISSLLAVIYIWRVVEVMYFAPADAPVDRQEAPASMVLPMWLLVGAAVYFGIDATTTLDIAGSAAQALVEVGR